MNYIGAGDDSHIDHAFNSTITESSPTLHSTWASYKKTPEFLQKNQAAGKTVKEAQEGGLPK